MKQPCQKERKTKTKTRLVRELIESGMSVLLDVVYASLDSLMLSYLHSPEHGHTT